MPTYGLHRPSGQARVNVGGRRYYLGVHGSPESYAEYDRIVGQWIAAGRPRYRSNVTEDLTITEFILLYDDWALEYYGTPEGPKRGHIASLRLALRALREVHGRTPANDFGPVYLEEVRAAMIAKDWSRKFINSQINRLKHMFRWGVRRELISGTGKVAALFALEGLRKGKTAARESAKVGPVADPHLNQVLPFCHPPVAAILRLQRLTGMRPGEACKMRGVDIDMGDPDLWVYRPEGHKTEHRGGTREIYLGPRAQDIIQPFLTLDPQAYLFSPAKSVEALREKKTAARVTQEGQGNAPGTNVVSRPAWMPGDRYTNLTLGQAVKYACDAAFPLPPELGPRQIPKLRNGKRVEVAGMRTESKAAWWARLDEAARAKVTAWRKSHRFHPNQIRHTAATELRSRHGVEAAQVLLGHKSLTATQIYAEQDIIVAKRIAREIG